MGQPQKTVFISYRRTNASWARAVFQYLLRLKFDVFLDFDGLASGDFEQVILENIGSRAHFLILLTPSALEGCRRPHDWLRREIEEALETKRNIVPLMLDGFDFDTPSIASQLTGSIAPLQRYNALRVPMDYFPEAMDRLCHKFLNIPLDAVIHPPSKKARRIAQQRQIEATGIAPVRAAELPAQQYFERALMARTPDEQILLYTQAIAPKPDYASALCNRGGLRLRKGDRTEALEDLNAAIRLEPNDPCAYINRSLVRSRQGDLAGACDDCDVAISVQPNDDRPYTNRGIVREKQGDLAAALNDYETAIRLAPEKPGAYLNRGDVRRKQGNLKGALEDFDTVIRLNPNYAEAYFGRAIIREGLMDYAAARHEYDTVIRVDPAHANAFLNRGALRQKQGDLRGAVEDYSAVIRLRPDDDRAFYNRGMVQRRQGNLVGAQNDLNESQRLERQRLASNKTK